MGECFENKKFNIDKRYSSKYKKFDCVPNLPKEFEEKRIGKSLFQTATYYGNKCQEIRTKYEPVSYVKDWQLDGTCFKDDRGVNVQYFCDMEGPRRSHDEYLDDDTSCSKQYIRARRYFENNCY